VTEVQTCEFCGFKIDAAHASGCPVSERYGSG
jgi:hypothetical protein